MDNTLNSQNGLAYGSTSGLRGSARCTMADGMAAAVGMGKFVSGREKKKQKKINTQSLEDSFGRLGLPVQEINAKYVKIPGQSVEKIQPEEVENNPGALFDTFGNAYVGSDRWRRSLGEN